MSFKKEGIRYQLQMMVTSAPKLSNAGGENVCDFMDLWIVQKMASNTKSLNKIFTEYILCMFRSMNSKLGGKINWFLAFLTFQHSAPQG